MQSLKSEIDEREEKYDFQQDERFDEIQAEIRERDERLNYQNDSKLMEIKNDLQAMETRLNTLQHHQNIRKEEEENNEYAAERKIAIRTLNALILTISLILHMFGNSVRLIQRLFYNKKGQVFLVSSTIFWLIFQFRMLYALS